MSSASRSSATRREGTLKGAYGLKKETGDLKMIIIATGSEVEHAAYAADDARQRLLRGDGGF